MQMENRIKNWIREEKSDALIRKERNMVKTNSGGYSKIKETQRREQEYLREQEEKWLRQLQ